MRRGRSTLCSLYFGGCPLWRVGLRGGHGMTLRCSGGSTMVGCSLPLDSAAERFGAPDLAMHSKGMSPGAYDPRGAKGMALTYATSSKGAHHMFATTFGYEIAAGNRLEEAGKGEL